VIVWVVRRIAASIAIVWAVVTLTFILIHAAGGSPGLPESSQGVDQQTIARIRGEFGLDQPLPVQYVLYFRNLARGNMGISFKLGRPVADALADALPHTFVLALAALLIDFAVGLALGVYQAVRERSVGDIVLGNIALFVNSMPTFWLALVLLLVLAQWLHWFPVGGPNDPVLCPRLDSFPCLRDFFWHLTLPALTLGLVGAAGTARFERAAMLEVIRQDYVRTARAKGLSEAVLLRRHAFKNAAIPLVTLMGLDLPRFLSGSVVVESIFAWPGMGRLFWDEAQRTDIPVLMAVLMFTSVLVVVFNLVADIVYAFLDPRIRYT